MCLNKEKLMKKLSDLNISAIKTILGNELNNDEDYPVFVKPKYGRR